MTQNRRVKSTSSGLGPSSPVGHAHRLQRHAAFRAVAGLVADDLGMHRAGVARARRRRRRRGPVAEIGGGIGLELRLAAGRAEIEALALVPGHVPARWRGRRSCRRRGPSPSDRRPARPRTSRGSRRSRNGTARPSCSGVGLPAAGSTVMPQTGSRTISVAVASRSVASDETAGDWIMTVQAIVVWTGHRAASCGRRPCAC